MTAPQMRRSLPEILEDIVSNLTQIVQATVGLDTEGLLERQAPRKARVDLDQSRSRRSR